jgi:hypothetical protein
MPTVDVQHIKKRSLSGVCLTSGVHMRVCRIPLRNYGMPLRNIECTVAPNCLTMLGRFSWWQPKMNKMIGL